MLKPHSRRLILFGLIVVATTLVTIPRAAKTATAGELDPSFGSGGRVISDLSPYADIALAVAIQPDNKILAAGFGNSDNGLDFTLIRYNPDGSLDPGFGSGGKVFTDSGHNSDEAHAIAIQQDGKIILAGLGNIIDDFFLTRYNRDGSLDTSFGNGGKVFTDFFGNFDYAKAVVIQPDGKIIAGGQAIRTGLGVDVFALARYNPDGSLDTAFGNGGKVTTSFFGAEDQINALALQPDGKIVAAGIAIDSSNIPSTTNFALARYNRDGSLDASFGTGGRVTTHSFSYAQFCTGVVIQPDGKIIAAGGAVKGPIGDDFALARYLPDGRLDPTFGSGGLVTTDFFQRDDYITGIVLQHNGKIVAAGTADEGFTDKSFAVARYNPDGSLDPSFGSSGKTTTDFTGVDDQGRAIALQPDGKIVVAGDTAFRSFALVRYIGDAPHLSTSASRTTAAVISSRSTPRRASTSSPSAAA